MGSFDYVRDWVFESMFFSVRIPLKFITLDRNKKKRSQLLKCVMEIFLISFSCYYRVTNILGLLF